MLVYLVVTTFLPMQSILELIVNIDKLGQQKLKNENLNELK